RPPTSTLCPYTTLFRSVNQRPGVGPDDMAAQQTVGLRVGEDFDKALGFADGAAAAVGHEGEFARLIGDARRLQLFFRFADIGDLDRKSTRLNSSHVKIS